MDGPGRAARRRSGNWNRVTKQKSRDDLRRSDSNSSEENSLQDGLKKQSDARKALSRKRKLEERIRRMKESMSVGKGRSDTYSYTYRMNTKSNFEHDVGVTLSAGLFKRKKLGGDESSDPIKILRIHKIEIDKPGSLKDAISAIDRIKKDDQIEKIEINVNGITDKVSLQKELRTIDEKIKVEFVYNIKNRITKLEEGFEGISKLMKSVNDKFRGNETIQEINSLIINANEKQSKYEQSVKGVNDGLENLKKIGPLIAKVENELKGSDDLELINGLKVAVAFETERELERLTTQKIKLLTLNDSISKNFENIISGNLPTEKRMVLLSFSDKFLKLAKAAKLTPEDVNGFFREYTAVMMDGNKIVGGELAKFIQKNIIDNQEELKGQELEDQFRDVMGLGLTRIRKRINPEDMPSDIFSRDSINVGDGSINQGVREEENQEGRLALLKKRFKNRNAKKIKGSLQALDTSTASDVFKVTTKGIIGTSGTNEGFAKKALKAGDPSNEGTDKLKFPTNSREYGGTFGESPNLIARQVVSSRLDDLFRIDVLASEIFSKDQSKNVIGISAKVPGLAIKDVNQEMRLLHRNFDFSNPVTQKSLSDLQLLDALTGQLDRHGGNIFIDPETGKVYGIDNDVAFPPSDNYDDKTALRKQFTTREDGSLIYNQNQIDSTTAERFLKVSRDSVEGVLRGNSKDPEKIDDAAIAFALKRFDAIKAKIVSLKKANALKDKWDDVTYQDSIDATNLTLDNSGIPEYNSYVQRSVGEFNDAAVPENTSSFQGF